MRLLRLALNMTQADFADNRAACAFLCLGINWQNQTASPLVISAHLGKFQRATSLQSNLSISLLITQCLKTKKNNYFSGFYLAF